MKTEPLNDIDVVRIGPDAGPEDLSRDARVVMPPEEPAKLVEDDKSGNSPQQFCLRWNNYQTNLTTVFDQLLRSESFVDVTLACDGRSLKAHKMVLSACSPYFQTLFFENPCQHPIVIMRDIKWSELKAAVEFMYKGEINVSQDEIGPLLRVAESLKIRGLADVNGERETAAAASEPGASSPGGSSSSKKSNHRRDEGPSAPKSRKRQNPSGSRSPPESPPRTSVAPPTPVPASLPPVPVLPLLPPLPVVPPISMHSDDMEIKPGIAEMIREEERDQQMSLHRYQAWPVDDTINLTKKADRPDMSHPYKAKLLENSHAWLGASTSSLAVDSYQYQLQSMWQKCWNTNQSLVHNLRFRERGPLKSWRPETMAEAIFSVLKEGLSLSQAARKYDIPYPTFVLYANRVHNMLGPSADGATDVRPKGRGRPQRILLGVWSNEHIRRVIRAVVFRDSQSPHHIKEEPLPAYPAITDGVNMQQYGNGTEGTLSPGSVATAAIAAVAQGLQQQMCRMVTAAHHAPPPVQLSPHPPALPPPPPPQAPMPIDPPIHLPLAGNGNEQFHPCGPAHQDHYFREGLVALARSPEVSPNCLVLPEAEPLSVKLEPFREPHM